MAATSLLRSFPPMAARPVRIKCGELDAAHVRVIRVSAQLVHKRQRRYRNVAAAAGASQKLRWAVVG